MNFINCVHLPTPQKTTRLPMDELGLLGRDFAPAGKPSGLIVKRWYYRLAHGASYHRFLLGFCLFVVAAVFLFIPYASNAAILSLDPESGSYNTGRTFTVSARVNTEGKVVNAIQGEIDFSRYTDKIEVVSLSRAGSVLSLWAVEPAFNNAAGKIEFAGGVPNPGFVGSNGNVLTVTFRPKTAGTVLVLFSRGAVLLNDGKGTNALSRLGGANYTIDASSFVPQAGETKVETGFPPVPKVQSPTHPNEEGWYSNRTVEMHWPVPGDIIGVSFAFNSKRLIDPGPLSDGLFDQKIFDNISDGVWYFHLKYRNEKGWSSIVHRKVQIDTVAPTTPEIENITKDPTDPRPTLEIHTTDELSGVAKVMIKIGDGDFYAIPTPTSERFTVSLPLQYIGARSVTVRSYDRADNYSENNISIAVASIDAPVITDYPRSVDNLTDIVVQGRSHAGYQVRGHLTRRKSSTESDVAKDILVKDDGTWEINFGKLLPSGKYKLTAEAIDERGAFSERTDPKEVLIASAILKIGRIVITYGTIFLILLAVIALAASVAVWLFYRIKALRHRVRKEAREAEETLHRGFDVLTKNLRLKINELEKKSMSRSLVEEEEKLKHTLETSLQMIEEHVERQIKDIEKS